MAKDIGEVEKGVHCIRCNAVVKWSQKKRISVYEYKETDVVINQKEKVVDRFNLCNNCYSDWQKMMYEFVQNKEESKCQNRITK